MNTAVISLGSNIHPQENIAQARELLKHHFHIIRESSLLSTAPIGIKDQPDFLNGTILLETASSLETFKVALKMIEDQLGRKREDPNFGPRSIDLDVIIWNNQIIDQDFYTRDFLKALTLEILPDFNG
jgi:2-amino-4-hydroxy-6-hydroxymethyldihydropteridine diphosphokinase